MNADRRLDRRRFLQLAAGIGAVSALGLPRVAQAGPGGARPAGEWIAGDFHCHSTYSHDVWAGPSDDNTGPEEFYTHGHTPAEQILLAETRGLDFLSITDHNRVFSGSGDAAIPLLPGVEWSLHQLHLLAIGPVRDVDRARYSGDLERMMGVFDALHQQGALAIGSIPEYWRYHRENLERFAAGGLDGFEIVNCAPKAIGFDSAARAGVVRLARQHDLMLVGASDRHGWGMVTCVWNLTVPGARGVQANRVLARPLALWQDRGAASAAGLSQWWWMLRTLSWPERISWLTWIALVTIYRVLPLRDGQAAGLGILARSLGRSRPTA